MFDRLHPNPAQPNAQPLPLPGCGTEQPFADHRNVQICCVEGDVLKSGGKEGRIRHDNSLPLQLPHLAVNATEHLATSPPELLMEGGKSFPPARGASSAAQKHGKHAKVVAFEFPPKETARCHSPTWEAYERRKSEKRLGRNESTNRRTTRLSKKPPPPSSATLLQQALASESDAARGRRRERADSTAAVNSSSQERKPPRKDRSRSSSFVSMLRTPFEFRRSSVDKGNDSGFIGGIKLEFQRYAAQQHAVHGNPGHGDSNLHPVLRKGNPEFRWSTPVKSPPPPPSGPASPAGADNVRRRYPPITRVNAIHLKTSSLAFPASPAVPNAETAENWRAKAGPEPGTHTGSMMDANQDTRRPDGVAASTAPGGGAAESGKQQKSLSRAVHGSRPQPLSSPLAPSPPSPVHVTSAAGSSPPPKIDEPKPDESKRAEEHGNNDSLLSTSSGAATGYRTAPSSPPPPAPPRRSSKRYSNVSLAESIPPLPSPTLRQQALLSNAKSCPKQADPPVQRSFPLLGGRPKNKTIQPIKTEEHVLSRNSRRTSRSASGGAVGLLPTSSSEDSGSDDHSTSSLSTPATSRPQSERELSLVSCNKEEAAEQDGNAADVPRLNLASTTYPLHSAENSDVEGEDAIQAAAEKVLAVFNDIPVQKPGPVERCSSPSSLAADMSFGPLLPAQPLNIPPRKRGAARASLGNTLSAASYLEEARKQPPAAAPPRAPKQRFGPPASFVLPDDACGAGDGRRQPLTPALTGSDVCGQSPHRRPAPVLGAADRLPIDKVFVECCSCKYYHDMPSHLYAAMSNPEGVFSPADRYGFSGALSMTVRCPWCQHEMSVRCCAGIAATVHIRERLH